MEGFAVGASPFGGPDRFAIIDWGDEHVLFDGLTGACHLLSADAGEVFRVLLAHRPQVLALPQLQQVLWGTDEPPAGEQEALQALLGGLREAGLVQEAGA